MVLFLFNKPFRTSNNRSKQFKNNLKTLQNITHNIKLQKPPPMFLECKNLRGSFLIWNVSTFAFCYRIVLMFILHVLERFLNARKCFWIKRHNQILATATSAGSMCTEPWPQQHPQSRCAQNLSHSNIRRADVHRTLPTATCAEQMFTEP